MKLVSGSLCFLLLLSAAGQLVACHKTPPKAPPPVAQPVAPEVRDRPGLLFTYLDDAGALQTAEKIGAIPEARRSGVRVIDLSLPPEQRGAGQYIVVADLRTPRADGSYPTQLLSAVTYNHQVSTAAVDKQIDQALATSQNQITLYSTSWCGVCAKTREYLTQNKVKFEDHDIEHDTVARAVLAEKARKAGVTPQGVPVIDAYGTLILGFDEPRLAKLIAEHRGIPL